MNIKEMYLSMGISSEVYEFGEGIWQSLRERFQKIDELSEHNQMKVIQAMQKNHVSEACLLGTTGYGYNDLGRETLERVYADIFHTEDALVRPQITCGTHALALALMSNLRPGNECTCRHNYLTVIAWHIPWFRCNISVYRCCLLDSLTESD